MFDIHPLADAATARLIGEFLANPETFDHAWAPEERAIALRGPQDSVGRENHQYWYAKDDGMIIAAAGLRENKYGSGGYEMDQDYFAVHRAYRRHGLAHRLLEHVERWVVAKEGRYIHVLSGDTDAYAPARVFYLNHGYRQVMHIPDYYLAGEGRIDFFKEFGRLDTTHQDVSTGGI
jgi:GNAT superfamily N-acetyltransferase